MWACSCLCLSGRGTGAESERGVAAVQWRWALHFPRGERTQLNCSSLARVHTVGVGHWEALGKSNRSESAGLIRMECMTNSFHKTIEPSRWKQMCRVSLVRAFSSREHRPAEHVGLTVTATVSAAAWQPRVGTKVCGQEQCCKRNISITENNTCPWCKTTPQAEPNLFSCASPAYPPQLAISRFPCCVSFSFMRCKHMHTNMHTTWARAHTCTHCGQASCHTYTHSPQPAEQLTQFDGALEHVAIDAAQCVVLRQQQLGDRVRRTRREAQPACACNGQGVTLEALAVSMRLTYRTFCMTPTASAWAPTPSWGIT